MPKNRLTCEKSRGNHTTYIDTGFMRKIIKKAKKSTEVKGILLGKIVRKNGQTRKDYTAHCISVGIQIVAFGMNVKQFIILYTKKPDNVAKNLDLTLKA